LEGEGMPIKGQKTKGNMIVSVNITIPVYNSEVLSELKQAFEKIER
jgi:DnaJ-class molecular chaperone